MKAITTPIVFWFISSPLCRRLHRLQATPVPPLQLFGAYVVVNMIVCLLQIAALLLFAVLVFQWPVWLQNLAKLLPAYAIVDLVRVPLTSGALSLDIIRSLGTIAIYAVVAGFIATRFFRWQSQA